LNAWTFQRNTAARNFYESRDFVKMAVCGMPSHYAEYVQSTSRAARSHPGIVFVCFKSRDPREHSQFEFFPKMHEHLDRLIEAVAVNRFASFAPQKTVPGLLSGLLLCDYSPSLFGNGIPKTLDHVPTLRIAPRLGGRNRIDQSRLCFARRIARRN
jgi:hypothetical protein